MTDYDRIMQALKTADAAGDTAAATRLAQMAREAKAGSSEFAQTAASMSEPELREARTKNDDFGEYLRGLAKINAAPAAPVSMDSGPSANMVGNPQRQDAAEFKRLYGGLSGDKPVGRAEAAIRSFQAGTSAGLGPRVLAPLEAGLMDPLLGRGGGLGYSQRRPQHQAHAQSRLDQGRKSYPFTSGGAEAAGAIPLSLAVTGGFQSLPLVGGVARTAMAGPGQASPLARALAGSTLGGTEGALYGFNSTPGNMSKRLRGSVVPAVFGAGGGFVAPFVGIGARGVYNSLGGSGRAARNAGMSRPGYELMSEIADADNYDQHGPAALAAIGDDAMLADSGPAMRSMADYLAQRPGPSQRIISDAISDRTTAAAGRVTNAMDNALGAPQGPRSVARHTAQSTAGARSDAYDAAYESVIDYADEPGKRIEAVLDRIPPKTLREAVEEANEQMIADGVTNKQRLISVAEDGSVSVKEMRNVEQLDQIKRALQRIGYGDLNNVGQPTPRAVRARGLARDLREAIGDAVPAYNEATRQGADKIAMDQALDLGRTMLRPGVTREVVEEATQGMSEAERKMVATGIRSQIDDALANVKAALTDHNMDAREAAKALKDLSSRASKEKLEFVLGKETAAALFKELDVANAAFRLRAGIAENSKTAVRGMWDNRMGSANRTGVLDKLARTNLTGALGETTGSLMGRSSAQMRRMDDDVARELAETLVGLRGNDAGDFITNLRAARAHISPRADAVRSLAQELMLASPAVIAPTVQGERGRNR
jgi:hypothetical protein